MTSLPLTQTCLTQPAQGGAPPVITTSHTVPEITDEHHVLIRVLAVALNPTDYKMPDYHPVPNAIMGCDFMGTVIAIGSKVANASLGTRLCGTLHGSNPGDHDSGTFVEYLVADERLCLRVPDAWTDLEGAALGGVGWTTVALAMEHSLCLKGSPLRPVALRNDGSRVPVLIYGGGTATGTMACQILAQSGYEPLAIASSTSSVLAKEYGAVSTFSYTSPTCGDSIKSYTKGALKHALDCITNPESVQCCFTALGRMGARYASLDHPLDEWITRKAVKVDMPLAYVIQGKEVKMDGIYHRAADLKMFDLGVRWTREVQHMLDTGSLKYHPLRELSGKWQGIIQGLEMLRSGRVRGQKLVVRLSD
ncbi:alcohol dehydrogenase GroES-like domain-containing protein [Phlyctema vagabunda]|uniref:Alcohol dehydrogenase GroES-like domain-containing protein n=1 Tax=Phlyctema vagabunda TaxID=108571 RepID=A0ABR4P5Y0_9HELO